MFASWFASFIPLTVDTIYLWSHNWVRKEIFCSNSLWTSPIASFWVKYLRFRYPTEKIQKPSNELIAAPKKSAFFWMFAPWFASFVSLTVDTIYLWSHQWTKKIILLLRQLVNKSYVFLLKEVPPPSRSIRNLPRILWERLLESEANVVAMCYIFFTEWTKLIIEPFWIFFF